MRLVVAGARQHSTVRNWGNRTMRQRAEWRDRHKMIYDTGAQVTSMSREMCDRLQRADATPPILCRLILVPRTSTATSAPRHEPLELPHARHPGHRRVAVLLFQEITQVARIFSSWRTDCPVHDQSEFHSADSKILI